MANLLKALNHSLDTTFDERREKKWSEPYFFVFGADPQFGIIDPSRTVWQEEVKLVNKAVSAVNKMKPRPRFFMIGGDLVNSVPSEAGHEQQIADLKRSFSELHSDIPLLFLPGNHDIGDTPTAADIDDYRGHFGDDWYSFWCGGVHYIVLNSQYYFNGSNVKHLKKAQHEWLQNQLAKAQLATARHIVVFQHIPLCLNDVDEADHIYVIPKKERLPLLSMYQHYGVDSVFSGHRHGNEFVRIGKLDMVVSSSMTFQQFGNENGLRIVKISDEGVTHQYYDYDSLPITTSF